MNVIDPEARVLGPLSMTIRKMIRKGDRDITKYANSEVLDKAKSYLSKRGIDFNDWFNEKYEKFKRKMEQQEKVVNKNIGGKTVMSENVMNNVSQPTISMDQIKQAVNECLEGKCDLLNTLKQDLDGIKTQVMDLAKIKENLNNIQQEQPAQAENKGIDLSQLSEQFKSLENTIKTTVSEIPNKTTSEFEGLSKAILNALADIRNEINEKVSKPVEKEEDIVPLEKALEDDGLRKKVLSNLEEYARKDKNFLNELSGLIQRCNLGDKEACEQVDAIKQQAEANKTQEAKQDNKQEVNKNDEILAKLEKELNELSKLRKKVETEMGDLEKDMKKEDNNEVEDNGKVEIQEKPKVVKYENPLRRLVSGRKG